MSVETVKARLALIQAEISGVKRAYAQGPFSLPPGDLPLFVNFAGQATYDWRALGVDYDLETRLYVMRLYVRQYGLGIDGEAERLCEPFFPLTRDKFAARPGLGTGAIDTQLANVDAIPLSDSGVTKLVYANEEFIGIEFRLQVQETIRRRMDAGE